MHRRIFRRAPFVAAALAAALVAVFLSAAPASAATPNAVFTKVSDWGTGWEGKFVLTNSGSTAVDGWRVEFDLPEGSDIGAYWDAAMTRDGRHFTFTNLSWNKVIPPGGSVSFGFNGSPGGAGAVISGCTVNGAPCDGGDPGPTPTPGDGVPGKPGRPAVTEVTDTSISLSWEAASGTVTGYRVYEGGAVRATVTGTSARIDGLTACSSHTYTVRAYNSRGESPASDPITATTTGCPTGSLPRHILTGYWHNFVNPAVELRLSEVPDEYDVIAIAFGEATSNPGEVTFALDPELSAALGGYTDAQFRADVQALKSRGKKVILSVGGEAGRIQVADSAAAVRFADSVYAIMQSYGFDGVDIDLENGLNARYMEEALRRLHGKAGDGLIITMAPQTIDMQSPSAEYFKLALNIRDILTVVHTQYYNSGSMLGCDQSFAYTQGTVDFITALACIQLENGLRPDQVALGLPAGPGAAGGGVVAPSVVNQALTCLATRTNCGQFTPPRAYPGIRGAMTWSINWDAGHDWNFSRTVKPHLATLP